MVFVMAFDMFIMFLLFPRSGGVLRVCVQPEKKKIQQHFHYEKQLWNLLMQ